VKAAQASHLFFGELGYVPHFSLLPGDPLMPALQSAKQARIHFGGREIVIGLNGARPALDDLKTRCGWNGSVRKEKNQ
jgi:hypothetical protein